MVHSIEPHANLFHQEFELLRYSRTLPHGGEGPGSHYSVDLPACHYVSRYADTPDIGRLGLARQRV